MAPKSKNAQKKGNQLSKEEKRLEAYMNHPANNAANQNENSASSQSQSAGSKKKKGDSAQNAADSTENQIAQLLKEVDLSKPLPDFTPLNNSISIIRNTLESMDGLMADIKSNNAEKLGKAPAEEEESVKGQGLTPDLLKKKDQIVKDINRTIELLSQKQARAEALKAQDNMSDMKEHLALLSANIGEDIKSKNKILAMF